MQLPVDYSKLSFKDRNLVKDEYLKLQNNKCFYCGGLLTDPPSSKILNYNINWKLFPKNFLKSKIHLHHDHATDLTIGAVHNNCNAVLWEYYGV